VCSSDLLISTFPLDVYRTVNGQRVQVNTPTVLQYPGGPDWPIEDWLWATQFDLRRHGNTFGIISERTQNGLPARIDLQAAATTVIRKNSAGLVQYKFGNDLTWYNRSDVWHEKCNPVPGLNVGLSPVAMAAWTVGEYLSMQDFALSWFGNGGMPKGELKHTSKKLDPKEARIIKDRYNATVNHGDVFVHGIDWELDMMGDAKMGDEWLEGRRFSLEDTARFFGVPTDLIDATAGVGSNIKYANITQQHLKFLVLRLGPATIRREKALTTLTPGNVPGQQRFVKLNSDAVLRMDPLQRAQYMGGMINARLIANSEARQLDDREPLTPEQIAEFETIYGPPSSPPQTMLPTDSNDTKS